ncbi:hypothetical protein [Leptospira noguchii]|uniref:hypothetical protein n=1 Tax=Leptospira noguchii TaxID=28182 RepID=UPI0002F967DA
MLLATARDLQRNHPWQSQIVCVIRSTQVSTFLAEPEFRKTPRKVHVASHVRRA